MYTSSVHVIQFKNASFWLPSVEYCAQIKESLDISLTFSFNQPNRYISMKQLRHFLLILTIYLFTDDTNTNISVI